MKWQDKLTKSELKHLKEVAGVTTLAGCKRTFEFHAAERKQPGSIEPCWECKAIARKLGFPV